MIYRHSFLFVLAVNRVIAHRRTRVRPARSRPARRAAKRRDAAMPTTWERTHRANHANTTHPLHCPDSGDLLLLLNRYSIYVLFILLHDI